MNEVGARNSPARVTSQVCSWVGGEEGRGVEACVLGWSINVLRGELFVCVGELGVRER